MSIPKSHSIKYLLKYFSAKLSLSHFFLFVLPPSLILTSLLILQRFRDWHLSMAVLCLLIADVLILGVYLLVEGVKGELTTRLIPNREHPKDTIGVSTAVSIRIH